MNAPSLTFACWRCCREVAVVLVQMAMLGAQHLLFRSQAGAWLLGPGSPGIVQPMLLFASSIIVHLPFAFLVPLLLSSFFANVALLWACCPASASPCCSWAAGRLCLLGVAAPLLAAWLLDVRARRQPGSADLLHQ